MSKLQRNIAATLCALSLFSLSTTAFAEDGTTNQVQQPEKQVQQPGRQLRQFSMPMRGGEMRFGTTLRGQTAADLTEEQRTALEQAQTAQADAYKTFLSELVKAEILSQTELDAYNRVAAQQAIAKGIDTMQWTLEKNMTLREALAKSGKEKQEAIAAFVTEGLLTQEQADALLASSTTERSINFDSWTVAQAREFQVALRSSSEERIAAIHDAVAKGLLTQTEADVLLCSRIDTANHLGTGQLTEEQQAAWKTAVEAYQSACEKSRETLKEAGLNTQFGKGNRK